MRTEEGKRDFMNRSVRDSERHNLELTLKRRFSRFKHEVDFDVDAKRTRSINPDTGEPSPRDAYLYFSGPHTGEPRAAATAVPWETAFAVKLAFPQPMVMEPRGVFNVADGARVTIRLHDDDWREKQLREFRFDVDQSQTIMIEQHSVRDGKWGRAIDMSKDPKMYGFHRASYYVVFEFDPRGTSPFIQDKFGWTGQGMTDKRHLWVDRSHELPVRMIRKVYRVTRDQVMGRVPVTEANVVPNAEYARLMQQSRVASR
jgi:hypothetical protein